MAVSAKLYGNFLLQAVNGAVNLSSHTLKVMLCTSSYVPDQDAHVFKSSVTGEVSGTGYTAGGVALGSLTTGYTAATNTIKIDAADTSWPASTITARYAVIYDDAGASDASKVLVGYVDFGADSTSSDGAFTIAWATAGIATITPA